MSGPGIVLVALLLALSCMDKTREEPAAPKVQGRKGDVQRPQLSESPSGLMTPDGPKLVQKKLADAGYYHGEMSGKLDDETRDAIKHFQAAKGFAATGEPDRQTLKSLGLADPDVWKQAR
jgi:peptidoglycan hydrolase-like protein with peptidoglycan-binding domain